MSHATKGGREPARGLAEEHSAPSSGETEADCMEEVAFQLGLLCLEGLRRRKGTAGSSEGGGERGALSPLEPRPAEPLALCLHSTARGATTLLMYREGTEAQRGWSTGPRPEEAGTGGWTQWNSESEA